MHFKQIAKRLSIELSEFLRIVFMQAILTPAAYCAPRSWAIAIANGVSLSLIVLPFPGMSAYRDMRRSFGQGPYRSFLLAWGWLARPFIDFVVAKRTLYGREDASNYKIVELNSDKISRIRESGKSFILATAHFQRVAYGCATENQRMFPGNLVTFSDPVPQKVRTLTDFRLRLQFGTMHKYGSALWSNRPFEWAGTRHRKSAGRILFDRLRKPGNVVSIHLDADWPRNSNGVYCRPFAGFGDRSFALGAVRLAKRTKAPIVTCVFFQEDDGTVVVKWGSPIENVEDEIFTMNRLIDSLEEAIAEKPTQYLFDIGNDRYWNERLKRWELNNRLKGKTPTREFAMDSRRI